MAITAMQTHDPFLDAPGDDAMLAADPTRSPMWTVWSILGTVSVGLGAYHGYKRHNGSIGWAIGWAFLGGIFPVVTPAIAFAQGFGQPMKK